MKQFKLRLLLMSIICLLLSGPVHAQESCYSLGYRYGMCFAKSMLGLECKPENEIVMPKRCRGNTDMERGTKEGIKAVYDVLNIPHEGKK